MTCFLARRALTSRLAFSCERKKAIVATGSASASSMRDAPGADAAVPGAAAATSSSANMRGTSPRDRAKKRPRGDATASASSRALVRRVAGPERSDSTPSSRYSSYSQRARLSPLCWESNSLTTEVCASGSGCSGRVKLKLRLILARAARRGQKLVRNPAAAPPPTQDDEPTTIGPHWRRLLEPEARPQ